MKNKIDIESTARERIPLSFEEKSVWIQFLALLGVLIWYGLTAGNMLADGKTAVTDYAVPFISAIGLVVVVTIVGHIVAAIQSKPEGRDERDRLNEQRAVRISIHILEGLTIIALILLVLGVNPLWAAHMLFQGLFLEEIVRNATRIILYRKGM